MSSKISYFPLDSYTFMRHHTTTHPPRVEGAGLAVSAGPFYFIQFLCVFRIYYLDSFSCFRGHKTLSTKIFRILNDS